MTFKLLNSIVGSGPSFPWSVRCIWNTELLSPSWSTLFIWLLGLHTPPVFLLLYNLFCYSLLITQSPNSGAPRAQSLDLSFLTHSINDLIQSHGFKNHLYANDSRIYNSMLHPSLSLKSQTHIFTCLLEIPLGCFIVISILIFQKSTSKSFILTRPFHSLHLFHPKITKSSSMTLFFSNVTFNPRWNPYKLYFQNIFRIQPLLTHSPATGQVEDPTIIITDALLVSCFTPYLPHSVLKHSNQSDSVNKQVILLIKTFQRLPISQRKDQHPYNEPQGTDVSEGKKKVISQNWKNFWNVLNTVKISMTKVLWLKSVKDS